MPDGRPDYNDAWRWSLNGIREKTRLTSQSTASSFEEATTVFGDPLGRIVRIRDTLMMKKGSSSSGFQVDSACWP